MASRPAGLFLLEQGQELHLVVGEDMTSLCLQGPVGVGNGGVSIQATWLFT